MARPLRFTFILAATAIATVLAAVGGWRYARASAPVNGPIVLLSIDTLRADHLPMYGYGRIRTPSIDALARDGVVFERAYAHAPQTLPAHVAILSGRLPFETGVRDNAGFTVKPTERLLPQLLRERGYSTGGVVSSFFLRKETGINQGFEFFDDDMPAGADDTRRDGAESEAIAEKWLDDQSSSRIFLFLHLYDTHTPYPASSRSDENRLPYDALIVYADEIVGRLTHYLKSHQLYDRSTIVLVSDNGEGLGDHGEQEHGLFLYDEAIHIPLIVKPAAGVGAGRRVRSIVQQVDLVPTILELVKAPVPGNLRGQSLRPSLDGTGELPEPVVYSEALYGRYRFGLGELIAVTDSRYRYIKAPRQELYDLRNDPHERINLLDRQPDKQIRRMLRGALDRFLAGVEFEPPGPIAPEDRERMQALGYVSSTPGADAPGSAAPRTDEPAVDPKDRLELVETYRSAIRLAGDRKWGQAVALLQGIARESPGIPEVWAQIAVFASRLDRYDAALDAWKQAVALRPSDADSQLGMAGALLKLRRLDEAREAAEEASRVASESDMRSRASSHALLALIALARHDADGSRDEAELAQGLEATLPMPDYVEGQLLYDEGRYEDALPLFEQAITMIRESHAPPVAELHFYAADTLARLDRFEEAEREYRDEIRDFPQNVRARAGLAVAYQTLGRTDEAGQVLTEMVQVSPTPDAYATAARLWKTLGNSRQSEAVRAESRRTLRDGGRTAGMKP